ncbi:hypothetical protein CH276_20265 [Rhodococcus sp. 06-470-2]|jgi:predicted DsbA family dithiol-disulfide isomerase|uniref:DsbA family oxidoreductase n=1 Tax=unclassified Rhodococcus (in: high G+C Gram-positive bacteria) TaxID=192944 RepID=UPI000B9BA164|nr:MULTISPECIES: DsbA family oxidoreductase [unclassified Rhodococcus (in: high G+C Gram-positive bacteria)]OZC59489.1 hypothetical protein CH276_20265 [Rhodococcus sp. 06-470-2]OZE57188.1 hypothetical protein CH265_23960 [Rhodococcus sp. 05-2221-1B]
MNAQNAQVVIEVWTDLGCPWCYIGKHRLQTAIDQRPDAERFEVRVRSFELNPDAPHEPETIESAFVRSHGGDASVVLDAERRIQQLAQSEGLKFSLDRLNANTFDFHRVVHHAAEKGLGAQFFSAVQDSFFAGEINPFDRDQLVQVAESIGLDGERVRDVLAGDNYAEQTRVDRREGLALGSTGVPFVVFDRQVATAGAQSVEAYSRILDQVAGGVARVSTADAHG